MVEGYLSSEIVSVGWIDNSRLIRESITMAMAKARPRFVIIEFDSADECLRRSGETIDLIVYHSHDADCAIPVEVASLRRAFGSARLVVLSDAATLDFSVVRDFLASGGSGFIFTRSAGIQMLVSAIALVGSGGTFVPREVLLEAPTPPASARHNERQVEAGRLTPREAEVLALLRQGKANKTIAHELGMSGSTVKVHVRHIMRKTGATNRTQAAFNVNGALGESRMP